MVDSILIRSITRWPKRIEDKQTLTRIYRNVFAKVSEILIDIAEHEVPSFVLDYSIEKLVMQRLRGGHLFEYWKKFKNYGMQAEVEEVIDALWKIEKEIRETTNKDLKYVSKHIGTDFKYEPDDWRKLFYALSTIDKKAK